MNFNEHWNLKGKHAFLSASNHHWLNYTDEKLDTVFINMQNKERGTRLHSFANEAIELGEHLRGSRRSLSMYVNDGIGYGMRTEQILYYSENYQLCKRVFYNKIVCKKNLFLQRFLISFIVCF